MSFLYFFRHGQAGTRDHYDALSEVGRRQAALLGEYLAAQRLSFDAAYVGTMVRQQQTAAAVTAAYERAGLTFPAPVVAAGWNEFDLDRVFREISPQLARAEDGFRREYEALIERTRASQGIEQATVNRQWSPCDIRAVEAWIRGEYPFTGESWDAFRRRVIDGRGSLNGGEGNVAIFTSATPTAIWTGLAVDIHDPRVLELGGALYNSSITVLRLSADAVRLFSFNGVPHLRDAAMRTFR